MKYEWLRGWVSRRDDGVAKKQLRPLQDPEAKNRLGEASIHAAYCTVRIPPYGTQSVRRILQQLRSSPHYHTSPLIVHVILAKTPQESRQSLGLCRSLSIWSHPQPKSFFSFIRTGPPPPVAVNFFLFISSWISQSRFDFLPSFLSITLRFSAKEKRVHFFVQFDPGVN